MPEAPNERIRRRRERLGIQAEQMADSMGIDPKSYDDVEYYPDELAMSLTVGQVARLLSMLGWRITDLYSSASGQANSVSQFRDAVEKAVEARDGGVQEFEEFVGWGIGDFLLRPEELYDWPFDQLRDVGKRVGVSWTSVLDSAQTRLSG